MMPLRGSKRGKKRQRREIKEMSRNKNAQQTKPRSSVPWDSKNIKCQISPHGVQHWSLVAFQSLVAFYDVKKNMSFP